MKLFVFSDNNTLVITSCPTLVKNPVTLIQYEVLVYINKVLWINLYSEDEKLLRLYKNSKNFNFSRLLSVWNIQ
jgi:hypothetical protein